jgi:hypothetical protein
MNHVTLPSYTFPRLSSEIALAFCHLFVRRVVVEDEASSRVLLLVGLFENTFLVDNTSIRYINMLVICLVGYFRASHLGVGSVERWR